MSYLERLKTKKVSGGGLPKLPKPTKPLVSAVSAVSAVTHAAHLKIISGGVGIADTMPAPTTEGMRNGRTPQPAPSAPKPITRPVLRFKLREGGGTMLGGPDDTPASLLAVLIDKWPDELLAAWSGTDQIYP